MVFHHLRGAVVGGAVAVGLSVLIAAPAAAAGTSAEAPRTASTPAAGSFVSTTPTNVLDTGRAVGVVTRTPVPAYDTVVVQIGGRDAVPASAAAVLLTVAVVSPSRSGYLTAYSAGSTRPAAASMDFSAHETISNSVEVELGAGGKVEMFNGSSGTLRLEANLIGYYAGGIPSHPGAFVGVTPTNALDTGTGIGVPAAAPVPHFGTVTVSLAGVAGIPDDAGSVAVVIAVVGPVASGYLTADSGTGMSFEPAAMDFAAGQTTATLMHVEAGHGSTVAVENGSSAAVRIVVNVVGYFFRGAPPDAGEFTAGPPTNAMNTAANGPLHARGAIASGVTTTLPLAGYYGVPRNARAAVLVVGAVAPATGGYLTVYDDAGPRPAVASVAFAAHRTILNTVVVPFDPAGRIAFFNGAASAVNIVADVVGFETSGDLSSGWAWGTREAIAADTIGSLSCTSPTFCFAVGRDDWQTYDGTRWSAPQSGNGFGANPASVACGSPTFCVASFTNGTVATFDGTTWGTPQSPGHGVVRSLTCPSTDFCAGFDGAGPITYSGGTWTPAAITDSRLAAISCPTADWCMATDLNGRYTVFTGSTWSDPTVFPIAGYQGCSDNCRIPVSCASPSFCMFSGQGAFTYDGSTFTAQPNVQAYADAVSCPAPGKCVTTSAVMEFGGQDATTSTYNDGVTTPVELMGGAGRMASLICTSTTTCMAIGAYDGDLYEGIGP